MTQFHLHQHGTFLVTTNAKDREPWCVAGEIPEIIIESLWIAKRMYDAKIFAFCVLPDHFHAIIDPGKRGLSRFMQSFKSNSARSIRRYLNARLVSGEHVLSADVRSADNCSDVSADSTIISPNAGVSADIYSLSGGTFRGWQHGFHAQRIAQDKIFKRSMQYVEVNAKRHGLVQYPRDWPWTSLHFGRVMDPMESLPSVKIPWILSHASRSLS